jgi:polysaccharide pyruvyl transferase WcaK-like protein
VALARHRAGRSLIPSLAQRFQKQLDAMSRTPQTIGLLIHLGGGNLGDDATLDAVMQNISCRWPGAKIIGLSMNPSDTRTRHGIPSYAIRRGTWASGLTPGYVNPGANTGQIAGMNFRANAKSPVRKNQTVFTALKRLKFIAVKVPREIIAELFFIFRSLRLIRSLDLLVICGGGQLIDCWGGPWEFPYTIYKWVLFAKILRVKNIFLNVGAGPLTHPLSRFFARQALLCSDYVSFRDLKSRSLVQQMGFTGKSHVVADSVYSLSTPNYNTVGSEKPDAPVVGMSPMAYCFPGRYWKENRAQYDLFIQKLAVFGSLLISSGHRIALFSSDIWFDVETIQDLKKAMESKVDIARRQWITDRTVNTTEGFLSETSLVDYVVTCRFHGVVFAHLLSKPLLAISYHPKVITLMNDIGLSEYYVDIDTFDSDFLLSKFSLLTRNAELIKARMAGTLAGYRRKLADQFDDLFPPTSSDTIHVVKNGRRTASLSVDC